MKARRPLWIIGIDGLEPQLLKQWTTVGALPTLASLLKRGAGGRLWSTPNQMTSSAWVSMATGANPGAHGVYNFQERVPGQYLLRLPTSDDRKLPAFWERASAAGLSVITARVPMTYPVRPVNGIQVADWLVPSPEAEGFVHPESLRRELVRRFPRQYWLEPVDLAKAEPHRALRSLLTSVEHTFRLFHYLLSRHPADLFFGVVREADVAGHLFWDYHSGAAQAASPGHQGSMEQALLTVYQKVDAALGELLEAKPADANVLIVSDHGMGAYPHAPRCVRPLLEAAGVMVTRPVAEAPRATLPARLRRRVAQALPWGLRRRFRPLRARDWSQGFTHEHLAGIDFATSRAFSFLSLTTGEIWLNLRGRDPQGLVERGAEQRDLEQRLIELFAQCKDAASGAPVAEKVWLRDELFRGPHRRILADLHVEFDPDVRPQSVVSRFGKREIRVTLPTPAPSGGMHRPYGAFVACGPDISQRTGPVAGDLMDVAPTALALLDLPCPPFTEGRILTEVLRPASAASHGLASAGRPRAGQPSYTDSQLEIITERLKQLGYL